MTKNKHEIRLYNSNVEDFKEDEYNITYLARIPEVGEYINHKNKLIQVVGVIHGEENTIDNYSLLVQGGHIIR